MSEWKLVPVEPTLEMIGAARDCADCLGDIYRAMLAAAPDAPAVQAEPGGERYRKIATAAMCCTKITFDHGGAVYDAAGGVMDSFDPEATVIAGSGQRYTGESIEAALLEMYAAEFESEDVE